MKNVMGKSLVLGFIFSAALVSQSFAGTDGNYGNGRSRNWTSGADYGAGRGVYGNGRSQTWTPGADYGAGRGVYGNGHGVTYGDMPADTSDCDDSDDSMDGFNY